MSADIQKGYRHKFWIPVVQTNVFIRVFTDSRFLSFSGLTLLTDFMAHNKNDKLLKMENVCIS